MPPPPLYSTIASNHPSNPQYPKPDRFVKKADPETLERRSLAAYALESFELQAVKSFAHDESMPRTRLRLLKQLVGLPEVDTPAPIPTGNQSNMSEASDEDMVGSLSNPYSNR